MLAGVVQWLDFCLLLKRFNVRCHLLSTDCTIKCLNKNIYVSTFNILSYPLSDWDPGPLWSPVSGSCFRSYRGKLLPPVLWTCVVCSTGLCIFSKFESSTSARLRGASGAAGSLGLPWKLVRLRSIQGDTVGLSDHPRTVVSPSIFCSFQYMLTSRSCGAALTYGLN